MTTYLHRVVGLYPTRASAESARDDILALGLDAQQLKILQPGAATSGAVATSDSDDVLKDLLRDGAIGSAVGTVAGAAATIALAAANITLFVASPVLGVLSMLGWGAGLGGLVGATVGSERSKGDVPSLIRDALSGGQVVLVVHAATEEQTTQVQRIVGQSMAGTAVSPAAEAHSVA